MRRPFSPTLAVLTAAALAAPACLAAPAVVANPSACPVGLSAEQHPGSALVRTNKKIVSPGSLVEPSQPQQTIDLSMTNTRLQRIVAAELEVHGTANKSRVVHTNAAADQSMADAVRNVHLVNSVPADQTRMRTVSVKDLTSVAWVSVIELRYADGSTWHARPGAECRVTPDPLMLVAGK
jgi:hypothetical protein